MNHSATDEKSNEFKTIESNGTDIGENLTNHSQNSTPDNGQNERKIIDETATSNEIQQSNGDFSTNDSTNEANSKIDMKKSKSYKDFSGIDTESFILMTLRDHPKDRPLLFNLEKIFREFIQDDQRAIFQFGPMNSYERMMVHRVAAYFGLKHNIDQTGQSVLVEKAIDTRIPEFSFQSVISSDDSMFGAKNAIQFPANGANSFSQEASVESSSFKNNQFKDKINRSMNNRTYRKQNRSSIDGFDSQQRQFQSSSHQLNPKNQSTTYGSIVIPTYPQRQIMNGSTMHNYVPVMASHPAPYHHGISLAPVLFQPTLNSTMSYVYPISNPQQISLTNSTRPIAPIYPSNTRDGSSLYPQAGSFVHVYPNSTINPYLPTGTVTQTNLKPVDYATNQFAMLNLQSSYDNFVPVPSNSSMHYHGQYLVQSSSRNGSGPRFVGNRQFHSNQADKIKNIYQNEAKPTVHNQQPN